MQCMVVAHGYCVINGDAHNLDYKCSYRRERMKQCECLVGNNCFLRYQILVHAVATWNNDCETHLSY